MTSSATLPDTHLCWRYGRRAEFVGRARDFLADGLAAGQSVLYVGREDEATLAGQLRSTRELDEGFGRGAVRVSSLPATYPHGEVVDPEAQVRTYAAATDEALAAGFTGLRVAADATALAFTPAQLDAFARYEFLVDHYMATHPMSAMCAYSHHELTDDDIAQLASLHPWASAGTTPFHLHASADEGFSARLTGELDLTAHQLWPLALARADLRPVAGRLVIDARGLRFVDHRCLLELAAYASRRGTTVVLRTRLSQPARVLELLDVTSVQVEQV